MTGRPEKGMLQTHKGATAVPVLLPEQPLMRFIVSYKFVNCYFGLEFPRPDSLSDSFAPMQFAKLYAVFV